MKILKIGTLCKLILFRNQPLVIIKERRYLPSISGRILYKVHLLKDGLEMGAYGEELEVINGNR